MWRTAVNQGTEAWPVKPWMHLKGKSCMMNPEARSLGKWRGGGGGATAMLCLVSQNSQQTKTERWAEMAFRILTQLFFMCRIYHYSHFCFPDGLPPLAQMPVNSAT